MKNRLRIVAPALLVIVAAFLLWPPGSYFVAVAVILLATALLWPQVRYLLMRAVSLFLPTPKLGERGEESSSVTWFDDYYTIDYIDDATIAVGEPRYHQHNYNYLILGKKRAILFDTGPGIRNIKPVVESLTTLPITVSQSHLHYDHIGNHDKFDSAAFPDLPQLKKRVKEGKFQVIAKEHLGFAEKIKAPCITVSEWWQLGSSVDLGDRAITIIHTPGHSTDSVSLYDQQRGLLFTGDFICPGFNGTITPGGNLEEYLKTTNMLLATLPSDTKICTAHRDKTSEPFGAPVLGYADLVDLKNAIENIMTGTLKGEGYFFYSYPVNDRIKLIADR